MEDIRTVAVIGNYLPRQCGIATFTMDVVESIAAKFPDLNVFAVPVNDITEGYDYPAQVRFELVEAEVASYRRAADFLNMNDVDIVCLQHEFGIYGGPEGSHVLRLLERLRMPVVTTLHTVLKEPSPTQYEVLQSVAELSDRLVVMAQRGYDYLRDIYGVPEEKIDFIHHGIPDFTFADPNFHKDRFGVEGRTVLLTFGLLSPNKGIEQVIEALPMIRELHPEVVYIVQGATHPVLLRTEGETYRLKLQRLARSKGVEDHVLFHNRFVGIAELMEFINAADIYVCPYYNVAQLVSGTLAYTVGAGKAMISTPLWYAEELLADGRGIIIPPRDSQAIATAVTHLLENEAERHAMRKRAYMFGRDMVWPKVAEEYVACFERARLMRATQPRGVPVSFRPDLAFQELPRLRLDHLLRMTDSTGLLQHAKITVPNFDHGYTTDDNARGLILAVQLERQGEKFTDVSANLASTYLAFMFHAFNHESKRFRNFMAFDRRWLEEIGSEDSHGRSLWSLGYVAGRSRNRGFQALATSLFEEALPVTREFRSPRACAFAILGIQEFLRRFYGHSASHDIRHALGQRLLELFQENASEDWQWFEQELTYCNAKLPHALLLCGQWLERGDMFDAAIKSLDWLCRVQHPDCEHFVPIGCHGWYTRGGERARFDQQPVDAHATLAACLEAYRITGDRRWFNEAQLAFNWFLGANDLGEPLFDPTTGGCCDGLRPDHINQNQGAESTLSFLLSLLEMILVEDAVSDIAVKKRAPEEAESALSN
jgi:glycosyltransferase involved in cell wall biosynthesis